MNGDFMLSLIRSVLFLHESHSNQLIASLTRVIVHQVEHKEEEYNLSSRDVERN